MKIQCGLEYIHLHMHMFSYPMCATESLCPSCIYVSLLILVYCYTENDNIINDKKISTVHIMLQTLYENGIFKIIRYI